MNQKIRIGNSKTIITLTDKDYKAAGGEASIFVAGTLAFKLYHEPTKRMLPLKKMEELAKIDSKLIMRPQKLIFDANTGATLGYCTDLVTDAYPLLKFFTRTFKNEHSVQPAMINDLVRTMQKVTGKVHEAKCLIVDFNELNVLVKFVNSLTPYFIDTDSYATPSFKATAIMDSVRDRRVTQIKGSQLHYAPDEMSDWFSWGVLAFWLYTNVHPFRGNHPDYKPRDKMKQMDDGISVFHKDVRVPPTVNAFSVIPHRHLDWFKQLFLKNERSKPPLPDSVAPTAMPAAIVIVNSTDKITVVEIANLPEDILTIFHSVDGDYAVTKRKIYKVNSKVETNIPVKGAKVLLTEATDKTIVTASEISGRIYFHSLPTLAEIGMTHSTGMFARNGAIYTAVGGKLVESTFATMGAKILRRIKEVANLSIIAATVYDGCVIQDLLGKKYLTVPYAIGRSISNYIAALDGYRIIEAKSDKHFTIILAEFKGKYSRFIIHFNDRFDTFLIREIKNVAYDTINFTVTDAGLGILLASPTELELLTSALESDMLNDPPFDSTMRLYSTPAGAFFINGSSIHQIKQK